MLKFMLAGVAFIVLAMVVLFVVARFVGFSLEASLVGVALSGACAISAGVGGMIGAVIGANIDKQESDDEIIARAKLHD